MIIEKEMEAMEIEEEESSSDEPNLLQNQKVVNLLLENILYLNEKRMKILNDGHKTIQEISSVWDNKEKLRKLYYEGYFGISNAD